jgi:hypothetical protein
MPLGAGDIRDHLRLFTTPHLESIALPQSLMFLCQKIIAYRLSAALRLTKQNFPHTTTSFHKKIWPCLKHGRYSAVKKSVPGISAFFKQGR